MKQVAAGAARRECFAELLGRPIGCGMSGGGDVEDAARFDLQHDECVDDAERRVMETTKSQATISRAWFFTNVDQR